MSPHKQGPSALARAKSSHPSLRHASLSGLLALSALACDLTNFESQGDAGHDSGVGTITSPASSGDASVTTPEPASSPAVPGSVTPTASADPPAPSSPNPGPADPANPIDSPAGPSPSTSQDPPTPTMPTSGPEVNTSTDAPTDGAADAGAGNSSTEPSDSGATSAVPTEAAADASVDQTSTDGSSSVDAGSSDADAAPPLPDECPDQAEQTLRGSCGCGFTPSADCEALEHQLVHRYSFSGSGQVATDSVGTADGTIVGASLNANGRLSLSGANQYVNLPSGLISALSSTTLEMWITWTGNSDWERIFDFGNVVAGNPKTYLFLTPRSAATSSGGGGWGGWNGSGSSSTLTFGFSLDGSDNAEYLQASNPLARNAPKHLALAIDGTAHQSELFVDGVSQGTADFSIQLSQVIDSANRLGRSQFTDDPNFQGEFDEFRIYDHALTLAQVTKSIELGPDATFSSVP